MVLQAVEAVAEETEAEAVAEEEEAETEQSHLKEREIIKLMIRDRRQPETFCLRVTNQRKMETLQINKVKASQEKRNQLSQEDKNKRCPILLKTLESITTSS